MSLRKNALIALSIVVLCMLLITQLIGNPAPQTKDGGMAVETFGSDTETTNEQSEENVELNAVVFMDSEQFHSLSQLNDRFRRDHPSIHVQLTNLAKHQAYSYLKDNAETGKSPDIMLLDHVWVNEFAASGYLSHELERHLQVKSGSADDLVEWNGYTWAVPNDSDPYVVVLNRDAFAQGEDIAPPGTLDEWFDYRTKHGADGAADGTIYIDPDDSYAFVSLIWAFGGSWEQAENGMYEVHTEGNVNLLELLFGSETDDGKNGPLPPLVQPVPLSKEEKWSRFDAGTLPVMIVRLSEVRERKDGAGEYSNTLVAGGGGEEGLWLTGTSYAVSSVTDHPSEAFEWIGAMLSMGANANTATGRSFSADPELLAKMELIRTAMKGLYDGSIQPNEWNDKIIERWSVE